MTRSPSGDNFRQRLAAIRQRAESIGARRNPDIDGLLTMFEIESGDAAQIEILSRMINEFVEEQRYNPNHLERAPSDEDLYDPTCPPDFIIGQTTETQVPYGPRIAADCSSVVLTSVPGGGKTSTLLHIILGVHRFISKACILIFDVKGEFACLASLPHPNIHVHKMREIRWNPLRPPAGVELDQWLPTVATHLAETRGLKKSRHVLLDAMKKLCAHFGVDKDPTKPWPSLFNVLDYLKQMPKATFSKVGDYKESLCNELQGLLDDTGRTFDTSDGIDAAQMTTQGGIFVMQMHDLPVEAQQFIMSVVVEYVVDERIARNVHNAHLDTLIIVDEAQLVLSSAADYRSSHGIAALASKLLKGRESCVGFIIVAHLLTHISRAVLASAKTVILVGGLGDASNIEIAANMMNLPYMAKTMIPRLGRGQAIVREIGKGCQYTDAFLVDIDPPPIAKDAVDEPTRRQLMAAKLARFPATPSKPLTDYPSVMAELHPGKTPPQPSAASASGGQGTSQDEMNVLQDAARYPDDFMKERQARLRVKDYKVFQKWCDALQLKQLVVIHEERIGKATYTFIEVSDAGWQALRQPKPAHYVGHGSFLHTVYSSRVAAHLKKNGWSHVRTEHPVGPSAHAIDIFGVSPQGVQTGFEITLSTSNVCTNALKSLAGAGGVQQLVFLCRLKSDCQGVERLLHKDSAVASYLGRIQVQCLDSYIS